MHRITPVSRNLTSRQRHCRFCTAVDSYLAVTILCDCRLLIAPWLLITDYLLQCSDLRLFSTVLRHGPIP